MFQMERARNGTRRGQRLGGTLTVGNERNTEQGLACGDILTSLQGQLEKGEARTDSGNERSGRRQTEGRECRTRNRNGTGTRAKGKGHPVGRKELGRIRKGKEEERRVKLRGRERKFNK
ncbi:uncharacterized protein LOC143178255 isoform X2 [Calliopsis andreniformis]|uniref:uncharacterized protein LOC143178255 isoform X2 n=1 Tax=Calliopsis andreniformis TaxID=337506 RepID=UPI003FCDE731